MSAATTQVPNKRPSSSRAVTVEAVPSPRKKLRIATVALSMLATVLLFGLVGFQALIVSNQNTIDEINAAIDTATRTNQRLRLEVGELESPERVRLIAISILGMVEPDTVTYLEPISVDELVLVEANDP